MSCLPKRVVESLESRRLLSVSLLADINPGAGSSSPGRGVYLNGEYIFPANNGVTGSQLWASNGTSSGTALLANLSPTVIPQNAELTVVNGELYFPAKTSAGVFQIWKSDGTVAGTSLVYTLSSGFEVFGFTAVGSRVLFTVALSTSSVEYVTDGTSYGTIPLGIPGNQYVNPVPFGSDALIRGDSSAGHQLFISDGTVAGTHSLATFSNNIDLASIAVLNGVGYFAASDSTHGNELWKTDGTLAGTVPFVDINPGSASSDPSSLTAVGNTLFFTADDGVHGNQLWKTDGTVAGTVSVTDLQIPSDNGILIYWMEPFGNKLLFQNVGNLYISDGTTAGSILLASMTQPNGRSGADAALTPSLAISGGYVFFNQNTVNGYELSMTDGTIAGTGQIDDINTMPVGSYPVGSSRPYNFIGGPSGQVVFAADDGVHGQEPWVATPSPITGGTVSGTVMVGSSALAGVPVYLDSNDDSVLDSGEPSTATNSDGVYRFADVPVGSYVIRQALSAGYTQATPSANAGIAITVSSLSQASGENFVDAAPVVAPTQIKGTTIGTAGSYQNDGNTIAKATDGNLATFFDGPTANGNWVGLDLGSPAVITSIAYASRNGFASRMNGGIFQASNTADFSAGVVALYTIGGSANPPSSSLTTQTVSNSNSYRYVRYLSPNNSNGDVAEVQFFGTLVAVPPPAWLVPNIGASYTFSNSTLTVTSGIVSITSDPSATNTDVAIIASGTSIVQFQSTATLGSLTLNESSSAAITATGSTLVVTALLLSAAAKLDLETNAMVIDYGADATSPAATITSYLKAGLTSNGDSGLVTTASAVLRSTTLGILDNAYLTAQGAGLTTFGGVPVGANSILLKYTYYGDANLDGKVDGSDYTRIDSGYLTHATGWYNGDFNDDGVVNGSDYTLIDNAFNTQGASLAAEIAGAVGRPAHSFVGATAVGQVPPSNVSSTDWWTDYKKKTRRFFTD